MSIKSTGSLTAGSGANLAISSAERINVTKLATASCRDKETNFRLPTIGGGEGGHGDSVAPENTNTSFDVQIAARAAWGVGLEKSV